MKKNKVLHIVLNPIFAFIFLIVLFSATAYHLYTGYDESLWMYIGNLWNNKGIPPYVGAVENKTPGIFILFSISDYLASGNIFFVRTLGVLATLFTSWMLYAICAKIYNKVSGVICMYVFGLITCWNSMDGFAFAHTEVFMILFTTMSFYFVIKSQQTQKIMIWLFLAGLSMGIAIAFKQIAITTTFALLVVFLFLNKKKSFQLQFKGSFIIVLGICTLTFFSYLVLYFYGVTFYDYIEGAWLILFNSGSKINSIGEHLSNFVDSFVFSRFLLFYPLIIWFFWKKNILSYSFKTILIIWLLFDFIGVNLSGHYFGHQIKQLLPAFSIVIGIAVYHLLNKKYNGNKEKLHAKAALVILVIGFLCFPYRQLYSNAKLAFEHNNKSIVPHKEIANWIQEKSKSDDRIYIIGGEPNLIRTQAIVERRSSSKHFQSIFLTSDYERDILLRDLNKNLPVFILRDKYINQDILNKYGTTIMAFVDDNYKWVKTMHNVEILQRK